MLCTFFIGVTTVTQLCGVAPLCQSAVIGTIACHCTSTSRIARTLALRSATPRSWIPIAVSVYRGVWSVTAAPVSLYRGACGAGALQAGRKSRGVSFHAGPPLPPQAPRTSLPTVGIAPRLSRRVYIFNYFWEVSIIV